MSNLHVAPSPLTNTIFCGIVSKDGTTLLSNKTDVTGEACAAVAKHVLAHNFNPTGPSGEAVATGADCYMRHIVKILGLMWPYIILSPVLFGIGIFMLYGEFTAGLIVLTLSIFLTIDTINECYWWSDIARRWPSI